LCLPGVWVRSVFFEPGRVVVGVALRRERLVCPKCGCSTRNRENEQDHDSWWRHLDLGVWRLIVTCRLRRLPCPEHGVLVDGRPVRPPGSAVHPRFRELRRVAGEHDRQEGDVMAITWNST
jgi:hypothetical protein